VSQFQRQLVNIEMTTKIWQLQTLTCLMHSFFKSDTG